MAFFSWVFAIFPVPASRAFVVCFRALTAAFRMPVFRRPRSVAWSTSAISASSRQRMESNVASCAHWPASVVVVVEDPVVGVVVVVCVLKVAIVDVVVDDDNGESNEIAPPWESGARRTPPA